MYYYAHREYTGSPDDQGSPIQSSETKPSTEIFSDKEIRRRMLEMAKASFPDGIPSPYVIIDVGSPPQLHSVLLLRRMRNEYIGKANAS
jgi:hypothetical protein